jgi:MFS family permease
VKTRLLIARLAGQCADGVFQAALFAAIAFNPEHQASPLLMAGSLAVLFGPYSILGPLLGSLLDRWDRRLVLLWANVVRALLIVVSAALLASGLPETVVLVSALGVMGASRFVASGLSAALPHVTDRDSLVTVNAVFTTLGGFAVMLGLGIAAGARLMIGGDDAGCAQAMLIGAVLALVAGIIAIGFPGRSLGPDTMGAPTGRVGLARAWRRGLALIERTPPVAVVLRAIGAHRWVFGMNSMILLVMANHAGVSTGLRRFLLLIGATAVGALLAAVTTPLLVHRAGRNRALEVALSIAIGAQVLLLAFDVTVLIAVATVLGWAGQTVKLCGDVAMQVDIPDESRGEVFAIQDAVFNLMFIGGVTLAALIVPADGKAVTLVLIGAASYATALLVVLRRQSFAAR